MIWIKAAERPRSILESEPRIAHFRNSAKTAMHLRFVFSTNLKRLRSERGLSQSKLALGAGLNRSYLSRLENGKNDPRLEIIGKLAKILRVTPAQLLTPSKRTNPSKGSPSSVAPLPLTPQSLRRP